MSIYKIPTQLVAETSHGLSLGDCQSPLVVTARVVRYSDDKVEERSLDEDGGNHGYVVKGEARLTFWYEHNGQEYYSRETFTSGDVIPKLGQWVQGVVTMNQWGSTKFVTTHLLVKPKKVKA